MFVVVVKLKYGVYFYFCYRSVHVLIWMSLSCLRCGKKGHFKLKTISEKFFEGGGGGYIGKYVIYDMSIVLTLLLG